MEYLLNVLSVRQVVLLLGIFPEGDKPNLFIFLLLMFAGILVALSVHELGHLLTGLLQGFRFELFIVGPLGIKRTDRGIRPYLNKNVGMMGGVAATVPVKHDDSNTKKFARLILAGPVASLLFTILSFVAMASSTSGTARGFWLVAGACSAGIFLATTLPTKSGVFFTDRARYERLISKSKAAICEEALLTIIAQTTADGSSKNLFLNDILILQSDDEPFMRFWGHYYEVQYYNDNGKEEEARAAFDKLLLLKSTMPANIWKMLKIEE